ncbi:uncharacterized protein N7459_002905 [Penicillium hispanicum]|uniref:uncharacterized protein n=1 Tax=Penicillium hispanicum TaxID=1080232 RepID=UPI0025408E20|nr:uncharacterized protein N7459_002905 [Penicillium hispanicum]KAJ5587140.1 hypothetical protein N7459_002905 [Penicillium hispanicum]
MALFSPFPSYVVGGLCLALGSNAILRPVHEYERFGLPLESTTSGVGRRSQPPLAGAASPLMYLKGIREITYGLALISLQYAEQDDAVTILAAVLSFAGLGDGFVVWGYGGDKLKKNAFGHWITFVGFAGWAWWRVLCVRATLP